MIMMMINRQIKLADCELKQPFTSGLFLILVSEMEDKTQIASGLFATKYNPVIVFIKVISALTILSATPIYLGKFIALKINRRAISKFAGIVFIVFGILCLI